MRLFRHALTACALLFPVLSAVAQDNIYEVSEEMKESDFQPRVDVGFEIPLADDFSFTINNELRFRDNCTRIDRNYLQGSFSWETCDYFSLVPARLILVGDLRLLLTGRRIYFPVNTEHRRR